MPLCFLLPNMAGMLGSCAVQIGRVNTHCFSHTSHWLDRTAAECVAERDENL